MDLNVQAAKDVQAKVEFKAQRRRETQNTLPAQSVRDVNKVLPGKSKTNQLPLLPSGKNSPEMKDKLKRPITEVPADERRRRLQNMGGYQLFAVPSAPVLRSVSTRVNPTRASLLR